MLKKRTNAIFTLPGSSKGAGIPAKAVEKPVNKSIKPPIDDTIFFKILFINNTPFNLKTNFD